MTLNCVSLILFSVIRIIHRNVGLQCFFIHLLKCLILSLIFSYIYISQGRCSGVVGYIIPRLHDQANIEQSSSKHQANVL